MNKVPRYMKEYASSMRINHRQRSDADACGTFLLEPIKTVFQRMEE